MSYLPGSNSRWDGSAGVPPSSIDPSDKRYTWEPYAISSPRRPVPPSEPNEQKNKQEKDRDWLHAFVTYSPYRTSNQDYGAKNPMIHFIDTTQRNQGNANDGRTSTSSPRATASHPNPNPSGSSRSSPQWK